MVTESAETRPAPYSPVHAQGIHAVYLYLDSKESMGIIFDFVFSVGHRHGQVQYNTHLRTQTDIIVPEIRRIARAHDFALKWFVREPLGMVDDEMPVCVSIALMAATPYPTGSEVLDVINRWRV